MTEQTISRVSGGSDSLSAADDTLSVNQLQFDRVIAFNSALPHLLRSPTISKSEDLANVNLAYSSIGFGAQSGHTKCHGDTTIV